MKKNMFKLLACLTGVLFVISSCSDKDPDPAPAKTKTELVSTGTWRFSAATVGGADASGFLQACQKDNTLTFTASGTGTLNEGATKCNAADPQTTPFTWNFLTNETQVFVSTTLFTGGSSTFNLVTLTESQLVLSQMITLGGTPQNVIVTFVH